MSSMFSKTEHKKPETKSVNIPVGDVNISANKSETGDDTEAKIEISQKPLDPAAIDTELLKSEIAELEAKIATLETELREAKSEALRAMAETQTIQRRKHQELAEYRKYASETLVKQMLPALLDLERIVHFSASTETEKTLEAVMMLQSKINRALEAVAIEKIAPEPGTPFDPGLHEAIGHLPTSDFEDHTVAQLVEPGWKMHDHLLHAAKVLVAVKPEDE